MQKKNLFITMLTLLSLGVSAQSYNFTWVNGTNTVYAWPVFTSTGVPSVTNTPGARSGMGNWKDANGNFWVYGGFGTDGWGVYHLLGDLWKYIPNTNQWALMKGSHIGGQPPVYGTLTVSSPSNLPGSRNIPANWTDKNGNLWMFGGWGQDKYQQQGNLNDLWKYDPTTNNWTWMSGNDIKDQFGVYGTVGVPSSTNMPGARDGAAHWMDSNGDLWIFGGSGLAATGTLTLLSDLWKYSMSTGQWTWMGGSNLGNQNGTYGSVGVPSTQNAPGGRRDPGVWTDSFGNFWMLGGWGYAASGTNPGDLNDLWCYDPVNGTWTWFKGSSSVNATVTYGSSSASTPGAREGTITWTDSKNNLWLLAGYGLGNTFYFDYLNDLWKYTPGTNTWSWVRGAATVSQTTIYGTKGVTAASSMPGSRAYSAPWIDSDNNLWLFGGYGYAAKLSDKGWMNDMWRTCLAQSITVVPGSPTLCAGGSTTLTASGATSFSWSGGQTQSTIAASPSVNTTYTVTSNDVGSCGDRKILTVKVFANPTITASSSSTVACIGESVTLSASGANSFTWSTGDNGSSITLLADDMTYTVTGVDFNGCMGMTTVVQTTSECTGIPSQQQSMNSIFPNPSSGVLQIKSDRNEPMDVIVSDLSGRVVRSYPNYTQGMLLSTGLEKGIYFVRTSGGREKVMEVSWKWVVE